MNRFVPVKRIQELLKIISDATDEIGEYNSMHCRICGDTDPKHGFYPLWGMATGKDIYQTSGFMCNECALTDEEYLKTFNEPKEKK